MAHSNHKPRISTRVKDFLLGERFRIVRSGYQYRIIDRIGRTVSHAKGPHGIQWALGEVAAPNLKPQAQTPEWQLKIQYINARCEDAKRRFAEGRC